MVASEWTERKNWGRVVEISGIVIPLSECPVRTFVSAALKASSRDICGCLDEELTDARSGMNRSPRQSTRREVMVSAHAQNLGRKCREKTGGEGNCDNYELEIRLITRSQRWQI